ncbi:CHAT domain-containing protein, partial [Chlorobaculum sp. 24CR]|uniref:CHAT domain-containing protein n=1 Tax=Chlorobaculum sp. 24CR TaxID=2508878 RepID=UPI00100B385A
MNQVPPLRLTPDSTQLLANSELLRLSKKLSEAYASKEMLVTDEVLRVIGAMLWNSLDAGKQFAEAKRNAGQGILPVIIESDDATVLQLPWETLHHPEFGFLARNKEFTLARTSPAIMAQMPEVEVGPLRILLFTSLPDDLRHEDQLQIENEQAGVLEALGPWLRSGHVVLEMPDDGRFSLFEELLQSFKPHLVWLSGHGVFDGDKLKERHKGYFLFEGDSGDGELVDEQRLAEAFSGTAVQALILSACQSGQSVSSDLNNGLMYALAQRGIPHVVGMRESIFDRAGVQFARGFFGALLEKRGIAEALQQARRAITKPLRDDEEARRYKLADLSFGQWCLPMLLSRDASRPLIRWNFTPQPVRPENIWNETLDTISLPVRFIGRRRELRKWQRALRDGATKALLVTGAGGVGKTAFAGKLVNTLKASGFEVFAFSARPEHDWRDTLRQMEESLDKDNISRCNEIQQRYSDAARRAPGLLKLLIQQFEGRVALLFDNLESAQEDATQQLTDAELREWIGAAVRLQKHGLRVVLTSRWALPEWIEPSLPLGKPVWRDFLAVAQQQNLPASFLRDAAKLWQAYEVLGGNFRALLYLTEALKEMPAVEEQAFLDKLRKAETDIQTNMLLVKVWAHRRPDEQELLRRMTAYTVPVAPDGVKAIALPAMPQAEELLDALLSVSLVERYHNPQWKTDEFLVAPLVRSWLEKQGVKKPEIELLQKAAGYHKWLLEHERNTLDQAMITHAALMAAEQHDDAHRIALDWIVGPLNMAGLYRSLLDEWLLPACASSDLWILAEALGQTGKQYLHLADYDTALDYLKRSLTIRQEIGDKSGEGTTLNNISQIYRARSDNDIALDYLKRSLKIQQEIGDKSGEGTTLNNISLIMNARGEYDTALEYLMCSLSIRQEIGDKSGEGTTLNNISKIMK